MPILTRANLLLPVLALCLGCAPGTFGTLPLAAPIVSPPAPTIPAPTPPMPTTTSPYYHAYGDSITFGIGLVSPSTTAYPYLLSQLKGVPLNDNALSGDQACDVPTRQIFPRADNPTTAMPALYTVLISTNDADVKGAGPYETIFNLCHQATLAWLATPLQFKVFAATAITSGPNHVDTFANFNSLTTDSPGSSLTFTFSRSTPGSVYLWYRIVDGSPGTFTYSLDGTAAKVLTTGTSPTIATQNQTTTSLALLRLPAVAAGKHTLVLTQTSAGSGGAGFVAIGLPSTASRAGLPRVLVGTTPLQLAGNSPCSSTPAACLAYVADITANVSLLASDGLDIELFDSRKYMTGTPADLVDQLHPNPLGQQEILHAITDIY